jgi:hypothetical protein
VGRASRVGIDWPDRSWIGRPLGPAVVQGALRGVVAGAFPGVLAGAVTAFGHAARARALTPEVLLAATLPLIGFAAVLEVATAIAARLARASNRRTVRMAGGFLAPLAAAAPVVALVANPIQKGDPGPILVGAAFVGLLVAALEGASGPMAPLGDGSDRRFRWVLILGITGFLIATVAIGSGGCFPALVALLAMPSLGTLVASWGELAGAALARRADAWLEPEWKPPVAIGDRVDGLLFASRRAWKKGDREAALESAFNARAEAGERPELAPARSAALQWLFELHLELGRLDEANSLVEPIPERDVLRAEVLRARGQAKEALERALAAAPAPDERGRGPRRAREAARAIRALALADLGLLDDATRLLDEARQAGEGRDPLAERFGLDAVARHVESRRAPPPPRDPAPTDPAPSDPAPSDPAPSDPAPPGGATV